jgi:hypothetical protein
MNTYPRVKVLVLEERDDDYPKQLELLTEHLKTLGEASFLSCG